MSLSCPLHKNPYPKQLDSRACPLVHGHPIVIACSMLPIWNVTNETKLCVGGGYEGSFAKVVLKLYSCLLTTNLMVSNRTPLYNQFLYSNTLQPNQIHCEKSKKISQTAKPMFLQIHISQQQNVGRADSSVQHHVVHDRCLQHLLTLGRIRSNHLYLM